MLCVVSLNDKLTIVIDPGHDGVYDRGTSINDYYEGDINLQISRKLKKCLDDDYKVIMTRNDENFLGSSNNFIKKADLNERVRIIKESNCDIFLSIHQNFFPISIYHGAEIHYNNINPNNKGLSFLLLNCINMELSNTKRSIKENNEVYILKHINTPGCLIECGYMSNSKELSELLDEKYQIRFVNAVKHGIDTYFSIKH